MSVPAIRAIGLGQVSQFRTVLPEHIKIIGAGGINSGRAMLDYLKAALPNDLRPTSDRFERLA